MMGQIEASPALKMQPAKNQHQPSDQDKTDEEISEKQKQIVEQIEKKIVSAVNKSLIKKSHKCGNS